MGGFKMIPFLICITVILFLIIIIFIILNARKNKLINNLKENIESNEAFASLCAVRSGNYHVLPKELFHYKPNERWDESYEYLAKLLYGEKFN